MIASFCERRDDFDFLVSLTVSALGMPGFFEENDF